MTKEDIADLRFRHREAVRRSITAEYDIVYVYAGHAIGGLHHFISRRYNNRTDESGGASRTAPGCCARSSRTPARCATAKPLWRAASQWTNSSATRASPAPNRGRHRHARRAPAAVDFVLGSWEDDSVTSRFGPEAEQEPYVRGLKQLTTKPVVGVGRFTSPDMMVHRSKPAYWISSGPRGHPSPTRSCPARSRPATSRTSGSASGATSACRATSPCPLSAAPKTPPWVRNSAAVHSEKIRSKASDSTVLVVGGSGRPGGHPIAG